MPTTEDEPLIRNFWGNPTSEFICKIWIKSEK